MAEDWGFFERRTNQEHMRILINCGWKDDEPSAEYTELLSVTVNLLHMMDSKSSKQETVKTLEQLESRLETMLKKELAAVYIGRINTSKRLELYYYLSKERFQKEMVQTLEEEFKQYRVLFYIKSDPDWETYRYMLPSALEEMFIHNAQMVYALIHKGDHIERPRHVYHWLMFQRLDDRKEMKLSAERLGYRIEEADSSEEQPGYPYSLVVSRWEDVRLETVNERVRELHPLVQQYRGKYDGWGSMMKLSLYQRTKLNLKKWITSIPSACGGRNASK
ncbi:DUF695 domain-containing protein [Paenibacillus abyssi]|uniref:DUF695 domain-containing protein n=1 Tax=Paenibacillus abyssi TaxID=1340531 RepID=A0A917FP64_9BACL|nr:DUF695 domain-containing protein [Paenibacillus abyssi]GGF97021.1 hypothetical protein GCM10010916_12870 [Paenibacillus abyssi]